MAAFDAGRGRYTLIQNHEIDPGAEFGVPHIRGTVYDPGAVDAGGAAGFLVKSTPPDELVDLILVPARGHTVLSPIAAAGLVAVTAGAADERDRARGRLTALTARRAGWIPTRLVAIVEGQKAPV